MLRHTLLILLVPFASTSLLQHTSFDDSFRAALRAFPNVMELPFDQEHFVLAESDLRQAEKQLAYSTRISTTLVNEAIEMVYVTRGHIVKDRMARHSVDVVAHVDMRVDAAWSLMPLELLLHHLSRAPVLATVSLSLDDSDERGLTPLCVATTLGLHSVMRLLLDAGARPFAACAHSTAAHLAAANDDQIALDILGLTLGTTGVPPLLDEWGRTPDSYRVVLTTSRLEPPPPSEENLVESEAGWHIRPGFLPSPTRLSDRLCQVDRVDITQLSGERFFRDYVARKRPLVITGVHVDDWPVYSRLARADFVRDLGHADVRMSTIPYGDVFGVLSGLATVRDFVDDYMLRQRVRGGDSNGGHQGVPLYAFDGDFISHHLNGTFELPSALTTVLAPGTTQIVKQLIVGPADSGSPAHYHCDAVNAVLYGRKQWLLTAPAHSVYSRMHPLRMGAHSTTRALREHACMLTQNARELVYVPARWGHATLNECETVAVAVEFGRTTC